MNKLGLTLASIAGVLGLTLLAGGIKDQLMNGSGGLAFITQSARTKVYEPSSIEGRGGNLAESVLCGNGVIEQGEQCEMYNGSGSIGTGGGMLFCGPGQQCVNCQCVNLGGGGPSSSGGNYGSGTIDIDNISCKTFYTVYSRAPAKVLIQVQAYNNGLAINLPVGYSYGSPVFIVRTNYTPLSYSIPIGANGQGSVSNVVIGDYVTTGARIITPSGDILCSPTKFTVKQNPEQYCGDGIQQVGNDEQCDPAIIGMQCEGQGICSNECKCISSVGTGGGTGYIDLELTTKVDYDAINYKYAYANHTITNKGIAPAKNFSVSSVTDGVGGQRVYRSKSISQLNPGQSIVIQQDVSGTPWTGGASELCNYNGMNSSGSPKDIDSNPGTLGICAGAYNNNRGSPEDDQDMEWY